VLLRMLAAIALHVAHCILAASGVAHEDHPGDALLCCQVLHQEVQLPGVLVQAGSAKALQQEQCRGHKHKVQSGVRQQVMQSHSKGVRLYSLEPLPLPHASPTQAVLAPGRRTTVGLAGGTSLAWLVLLPMRERRGQRGGRL
jgi:hypothetical protein